jgi:hypothetical protein
MESFAILKINHVEERVVVNTFLGGAYSGRCFVYKFKNSHGEFMISTPTLKSRTAKPSLQSEGIVGATRAIGMQRLILCMLF